MTRTAITNLALREIGSPRVDTWEDTTPEAIVARDCWDQAVLKALARHEWQFAMKGAQLPQQADTPDVRFDYRYTLPADFVRIGAVSEFSLMEPTLDESDGWAIRNGVMEANAATLFIEYVYNAPAIGAWTPWFIDVLVADFASVLAGPLKSTAERERLEQLAQKRLRDGIMSDSAQQQVQKRRIGGWRYASKGSWRG
jgi:hypothetical protein